jgi:hypothetical protein
MDLGSGLDFLEPGQRTQASWLAITGAAAGSGKQRESGNNECGEYANHGMGGGLMEIPSGQAELFSWCHIGRLAGGRSSAGATGSGKKRGNRGYQDDFHRWDLVFLGDWTDFQASLLVRLTSAPAPARQKLLKPRAAISVTAGC